MSQPKYSTANLPLANPIFIQAGSPEEYLLDPRYYRIVDSLPKKSSLKTALPSISVPQNQFTTISKISTPDKTNSVAPQQLSIIQLDDITIFSGPTSYAEGSNKKYEVTIKINNSKNLLIKDVEYRIAEANE